MLTFTAIKDSVSKQSYDIQLSARLGTWLSRYSDKRKGRDQPSKNGALYVQKTEDG